MSTPIQASIKETARGPHKTPPDFTAAEKRRWPHYVAAEMACKCPRLGLKFCQGEYFHDPGFLDAAERLRADVGQYGITSARRCRRRNMMIGGASRSEHTLAMAWDIPLAGHDPVKLARAALKAGFKGIGFGRTFLHVDMGRIHGGRAWNYQASARAQWVRWFGFDPVARYQAKGSF